jgi:hypothetical protein
MRPSPIPPDLEAIAKRVNEEEVFSDGDTSSLTLDEVDRAIAEQAFAKDPLFSRQAMQDLMRLRSLLLAAPDHKLVLVEPPQLRRFKGSAGVPHVDENAKPIPAHDAAGLATMVRGVLRAIDQGDTNACGTTSLAMVMRYFQGPTDANTVAAIDEHIRAYREIDGYTSPRDIVDYAAAHGMRGAIVNDSSLPELYALLDLGVPVVVLTDWKIEDGQARPTGDDGHYVVVSNYRRYFDPNTGKFERELVIVNPNRGVEHIDAETFDTLWRGAWRFGQRYKVKGVPLPTGMRRLMIPLVPADPAASITNAAGVVRRAGSIRLPREAHADGWRGALAQRVSHLMRTRLDEPSRLVSFLRGDRPELDQLVTQARQGNSSASIAIVDRLLSGARVDADEQRTINEILRLWPSEALPGIVDALGPERLAALLANESIASELLARLAVGEARAGGAMGSSSRRFAVTLVQFGRYDALAQFAELVGDSGGLLDRASSRPWIAALQSALLERGGRVGGQPAVEAAENLLFALSPPQLSQLASELGHERLTALLSDGALSTLWGRLAQAARAQPTLQREVEAFGLDLLRHGRYGAVQAAVAADRDHRLITQLAPRAVASLLEELMRGYTGAGEEELLQALLRDTSWSQLEAVLLAVDPDRFLGELGDDQRRAAIVRWSLRIGLRGGSFAAADRFITVLARRPGGPALLRQAYAGLDATDQADLPKAWRPRLDAVLARRR